MRFPTASNYQDFYPHSSFNALQYHVAEVTVDLKLQEGLKTQYNDKKEKRAVAKSYIGKGFLIYEEMRKYFPIYEEAVSHI